MAGRKYEKYVMPVEAKSMRDGELPCVSFKAQPHGVEASWGILVAHKVVDPEVVKRLFENPHKHPHHQFITYFGSNPYDQNEFGAEISVCLGEEREEYIIDRPTVLHFPPGLIHAYGQTPHKIDKPVFHLDLNFTPEYIRENLPEEK